MHEVKVFNGTGRIDLAQVFIDGKALNCAAVIFSADTGSTPTFVFKVPALADIEAIGDIQFHFTSPTITDTVKILRHELLQYGDIYDGFLASIESALKEANPYARERDLAETILNRMIGVCHEKDS